jgi:nitrite reductase/ring-hydroxylating ferredoxin subunit
VPPPDPEITGSDAATPMGEFMRRYWQPVCLSEELTDLPHPIRIMGEDLIAFRDLSGRVGVVHRQCSHRGTSLEFAILTERGIRCCYHGWLFDIDGTIMETPGEPENSRGVGMPRRLSGTGTPWPGLRLHGAARGQARFSGLRPDQRQGDQGLPDVELVRL